MGGEGVAGFLLDHGGLRLHWLVGSHVDQLLVAGRIHSCLVCPVVESVGIHLYDKGFLV